MLTTFPDRAVHRDPVPETGSPEAQHRELTETEQGAHDRPRRGSGALRRGHCLHGLPLCYNGACLTHRSQKDNINTRIRSELLGYAAPSSATSSRTSSPRPRQTSTPGTQHPQPCQRSQVTRNCKTTKSNVNVFLAFCLLPSSFPQFYPLHTFYYLT